MKKIKPGKIKTKRCRRCKDYFFPSHGSQVRCPFCQGKYYGGKGRPPKYTKCEVFGCKQKHYAKRYCEKHYKQLIKTPADIQKRRIKSAEKWIENGAIMCEMFKECEVYFIPKARNQFGIQKICPTCAMKRSYIKKRDKAGRPHKI